jgi:hypothetical protein
MILTLRRRKTPLTLISHMQQDANTQDEDNNSVLIPFHHIKKSYQL